MKKNHSISRRDFIKRLTACGCGAFLFNCFPNFSVPTAWAESGNGTKLLFVNLNGGYDGITMLQPSLGNLYNTTLSLRPSLTNSPGSLLDVGGGYGFHPLLTTFKNIYNDGQLAAVFNVGYDNMSRSHLDAEVVYARGVPDRLNPTASGFLTRLGTEFNWGAMQAISVTGADKAFEGGPYRGIQVSGLESFRFMQDESSSTHESRDRRDTSFSVLSDWELDPNKSNQKALVDSFGLDINATEIVHDAYYSTTFPTAYPNSRMARGFKDIDIAFSSPLIDAQVGYMRFVGFDTHSTQAERMQSLLPEFNSALAAFIQNMKQKGLWNKLIILVYSEFGRTNRENGSQGTDHGGALPVFLLGGKVKGGLVGEMLVNDLTDYGWLPMRYNIVSVYRSLLAQMGYDPNRVFAQASGAALPTLFI